MAHVDCGTRSGPNPGSGVGFLPIIAAALTAASTVYAAKKSSDAQKDAEKAAAKQAAAEQAAAARAARAGAGGMKWSTVALVGGGVAVVGIAAWLMLRSRRKKRSR